MSLPPGFLDELRTRTSLSQVVGRKVSWDMRKSNQGKGDMWAPCPFHQEKTASFHVDDRKGYYYCFGCHAKGDALTFVQETENVSFIEAVEILAGEAGMPMPARDAKAKAKADRRSVLIEVMEQAVQFFRLQLKTGAAAETRAYLDRRGLGPGALERFEIGFAPASWQGLWDHLRSKDVSEEMILAAGLAKPSSKGGKPYDTFRNRIMFPIRDARGRAIAFGGRAMDPTDNAKYLNSPETELFDKGRNLYNMGPAREAAGKGQPLIVAEGYMDVIALVEAGFGAAVAPLGTAVTEEQMHLLWRISDEPVMALDGDTAGLRAAHAVIDRALPLLKAGKGLRFAIMPEGKDPDDILRSDGAEALGQILQTAQPMVQLLWQGVIEGRVLDSPERKAALDMALREKVGRITDPTLRSHYGREIAALLRAVLRPQWSSGSSGSSRAGWKARRGAMAVPSQSAKTSMLAAAQEGAETRLRASVILASLLICPDLLPEFELRLDDMLTGDQDLDQIRDLLLRYADTPSADRRGVIEAEIGPGPLETLLQARHVAITPCIRNPGDIDLARQTVTEELDKLDADKGLQAEIEEAAADPDSLSHEAVTWRLGDAANTRNRAQRSGGNDEAPEFDLGPNGAHIDKRERDAFERLMQKIEFGKTRR
ncbi:MAG: DNA primase [Rhodobacteraceae bacterium]|nr:DNA primase [Paracoccaceae bacterium]